MQAKLVSKTFERTKKKQTMSNDILGSLVRVLTTVPKDRLGLLQDYARKLAVQGGEEWAEEGKKFLRKKPCWSNCEIMQVSKPKLPPSILQFILKVGFAGTSDDFVATEKLKLKKDGGICAGFGPNFESWFLKDGGKREKSVQAGSLYCYRLRKDATDKSHESGGAAIIPELGGGEKSETTLSEMFSLMEKQKNGEDGVLLNNFWDNIFYIRDHAGELRAVYMSWHDDGWCVGAGTLESTSAWFAGVRVFSRSSVLISSETPVPA